MHTDMGSDDWRAQYEAAYRSLDADQRRVVEMSLEPGPVTLVVPAGAGSGKTKTMVVVAARAINDHGYQPGDVAVLTFTNAAAAELSHRLLGMLRPDARQAMQAESILTFDKFIARQVWRNTALRKLVGTQGPKFKEKRDKASPNMLPEVLWFMHHIISTPPTWGPYKGAIPGLPGFQGMQAVKRTDDDDDDAYKAAKNITAIRARLLHDGLRFDSVDTRPRAIEGALALMSEIMPSFADQKEDSVVIQAIRYFELAKQSLGAWESLDVLDTYARHGKGARKLVIVDESQDNDVLLTRAGIDTAIRGAGRAILVGDPQQSIYWFRGASPDTFQQLPTTEGARVTHLARNYRSGSWIVEAGNLIAEGHPWAMGVAAQAVRQETGEIEVLDGQTAENTFAQIAKDIQARIQAGASPGEFAVLTMSNTAADNAQASLDGLGIPNVRLGSRMGMWDTKDARATMGWIAIGAGADVSVRDAAGAMLLPRLRMITERFLEDHFAGTRSDILDTARGVLGRIRSRQTQHMSLQHWIMGVEIVQWAHKTLGWEAMLCAVALLIDPKAAQSVEWSGDAAEQAAARERIQAVEEAAAAKAGREVREDAIAAAMRRPDVLWPEVHERVAAWHKDGITAGVLPKPAEATGVEASEAAEEDADEEAAIPGTPQLVLSVARKLGSVERLRTHALACAKTPILEEDMPSYVAEDPARAAAWLAEVELMRKHRVACATVWTSKGLEWSQVYAVVPMASIDIDYGFTAERVERDRLLYVAVTRAANRLVLAHFPIGPRVGLPGALAERVMPFVYAQQRLRALAAEIEGTGWAIRGSVTGLRESTWTAVHPLLPDVTVAVQAGERLAQSDLHGMTYMTAHTATLTIGGAAWQGRTHKAPFICAGALDLMRALTPVVKPIAPTVAQVQVLYQGFTGDTGRKVPEARAEAVALLAQLTHGTTQSAPPTPPDDAAPVEGEVEEPSTVVANPTARGGLQQDFIRWLTAAGERDMAEHVYHMSAAAFTGFVAGLGYDPEDLCRAPQPPPAAPPATPAPQVRPAPLPMAPAQPGAAVRATDLVDASSWVRVLSSEPYVGPRDAYVSLPYPSEPSEDGGPSTTLSVFLGQVHERYGVLYTAMSPHQHQEQPKTLPARLGAIVLSIALVPRAATLSGTAYLVRRQDGAPVLTPLVTWTAPVRQSTDHGEDILARIGLAVGKHLIHVMRGWSGFDVTKSAAEIAAYEVGVGLFGTLAPRKPGERSLTMLASGELYHPRWTGQVRVPLILPRSA